MGVSKVRVKRDRDVEMSLELVAKAAISLNAIGFQGKRE